MSKRCGTKATGAKGVVYSLILRHTIDWTVVNPWAKLDTPPSGQRDLPPPVPSRQRILHGLVGIGKFAVHIRLFFFCPRVLSANKSSAPAAKRTKSVVTRRVFRGGKGVGHGGEGNGTEGSTDEGEGRGGEGRKDEAPPSLAPRSHCYWLQIK